MKKLFLALAIMLGMTAYGQDHLKFMGKDIAGSVSDFAQYLINEKGFAKKRGENILHGRFANQDCEVRLIKGADGMLFSVEMLSDKYFDNWVPLYKTYCDWVEIYTVKYGNPKSVSKSLGKPYYDMLLKKGDSMFAMNAIEDETCNFKTTFETDGGHIEISIIKVLGLYQTGRILIKYCDNINDKVQQTNILEDI